MIPCFRCGFESHRSSMYFISTQNPDKTTHLLGAAELGLCPDCIKNGYRRLIRKPAVTMILWMILSLAFLLISARLGTSAPSYIKIICVIVCIFALYNCVRDIIVVSVYRTRIKDISAFLPEMTQTDFNEQVNTHLKYVDSIKSGVVFNFEDNFNKSALNIKNGAKRVTRRIKEEDITQPVKNLTDNGQELDSETANKIQQSICDYYN